LPADQKARRASSRRSASLISLLSKARRHPCSIIDGIAEPRPIEELVRESKSYDVVGITIVSAYALRALELIRAMKAEAGTPPVVVGGPHVTALPESTVRQGADAAVVGEGEQSMEIVEWLGGQDRLPSMPSAELVSSRRTVCVHRQPAGSILDQVPLPVRTLLPMHRYRSSIARATAQPSHSLPHFAVAGGVAAAS
jgi:radical SAM superfamily enzyme YgiQ (UPF0313 family)